MGGLFDFSGFDTGELVGSFNPPEISAPAFQAPAAPASTDPFAGGSEGLAQFRGSSGQAAAEAPGSPDPAPKSFGSIAKEVGGDVGGFAKGALPFAQLGLAGFGVSNALAGQGAARQQGQILKRQQENQQRATAPLVAFGETQLQRAEAGQINPAIQAQIDQWLQAEKFKIQQFFAHNKISDSTMINSALGQAEAKAEAMRAGDIHLMEQEGVTALHAAAGAATQGATTAQTEQSQLDTLLAEANKALASLSGQQ